MPTASLKLAHALQLCIALYVLLSIIASERKALALFLALDQFTDYLTASGAHALVKRDLALNPSAASLIFDFLFPIVQL
jgi:hypothetical protein